MNTISFIRHGARALRGAWEERGFTLIETMIAITLLTFSIIAPMALTVQSLESAYFARDEITAENLAQEGIEAVRAVRDGNILSSAEGNPENLFSNIPFNTPFIIDAHYTNPTLIITSCSSNPCSVSQDTLQIQGSSQLFGYSTQQCPSPASGWTCTIFQRYAIAVPVGSPDSSGVIQEIRLTVYVTWKTGSFASRSFHISENLYNWVNPNSATP